MSSFRKRRDVKQTQSVKSIIEPNESVLSPVYLYQLLYTIKNNEKHIFSLLIVKINLKKNNRI